jgi:aryl-alcohol dehydrogenase-like predicted oxidoreductase
MSSLPCRSYGPDSIPISVIGFGGILVTDQAPEYAARIVAEAIERGINYFDVAPTYGNAQERLGPALEPYRRDVFLACKTTQRTAAEARAEFEESCRLLRTDYFDLYQLHAVTDVQKDVEVAFAHGGVMEFIMEMKKQGRIRHVGFSCHNEQAGIEALRRYPFDSVLMPVNFALWMESNWGPALVGTCREAGASVLALKSMALAKWRDGDARRPNYPQTWYEPIEDPALADLAVRWTLMEQPVVAALPPGVGGLWRTALEIAGKLRPLTAEEKALLKERSRGLVTIFP